MLQERFANYYELGMLFDLAMERGAKITFDPYELFPLRIEHKGNVWNGSHNGGHIRSAQFFIDRTDLDVK